MSSILSVKKRKLYLIMSNAASMGGVVRVLNQTQEQTIQARQDKIANYENQPPKAGFVIDKKPAKIMKRRLGCDSEQQETEPSHYRKPLNSIQS